VVVSRIEGVFLERALDIGLAEMIGRTLREIDATIATLSGQPETRYLARLRDQKTSLRNPTLRTTAALVVALCAEEPALTGQIRRPFADLAELHPELLWFYAQLPAEICAAGAMRQSA
jgi:hypothetical protein